MKKTYKKIEGYGNTMGGKMKETAGKIIGDSKMRFKGKAQHLKGKMQVAATEVKESVKKSLR